MMKDCSKLFPVLISVVFCFIEATGCRSLLSDDVVIDLRKSPAKRVSVNKIYDRIELVSLESPGAGSMPSPSLSSLSVTEDRFYFKCGDSTIVSYFKDGRLSDSMAPGGLITDFSIYRDSVMDVLSDKEILSYSLPNHSLTRRANLDTPVSLKKIARWRNQIFLPGYVDSQEYICEYDCERNSFARVPRNANVPDVKKNVEQMSFFRYDDHLMSVYPYSGRIWENAVFSFIFLEPDFKIRQNDDLEFLSAQVSDHKIFYLLLLNGEEYLLALDRADRTVSYLLDDGKEHQYTEHGVGKESLCVNTTREGLHLPLGVIRDEVNYVSCTAADLSRYVNRDMLDSHSAEVMDEAMRNNSNVVLKYYLAAP